MQKKAVGWRGRLAAGKHESRILGLPSTLGKQTDRTAGVAQSQVSLTVSALIPPHISKSIELEVEAKKAIALRGLDSRRLY